MTVVDAIVLFLGFSCGYVFILMGWRILTSDAGEYRRVKLRYRGVKSSILGHNRVLHGAVADDRFEEGISIDESKSAIELNGKISSDVINRILR